MAEDGEGAVEVVSDPGEIPAKKVVASRHDDSAADAPEGPRGVEGPANDQMTAVEEGFEDGDIDGEVLDPFDLDQFDLEKAQKHEYEVVNTFSEAQMRRYESYKRSDLKKEKMKKILMAINPAFGTTAPSDPVMIAIKGLAKLFVGEVVEAALEVMRERDQDGPLLPQHIREAYRRIRRNPSSITAGIRKPDSIRL
uniref:Transcription initiation factor TFIID subunit 11 n=1 Tax=Compsopogon caeruleus TaxID=31354 RepID=A0A7S1XG47_9RHOD|mmetsp:Transcript_5889/g.11635  ORF Transcript_5889/g.11635 Transcript_5889/m.11635 type:complete len:196 (+) Transcript_5889:84-671(+)